MRTLDLAGLIPATLTPMTDRFEVNEGALRRYIHWLLGFDGLKAVAVNMDTGEGSHLTGEEKKGIIAVWKREMKKPIPILAGITGPSTSEAVRQAREAEDAGADALVIFPIPAFVGRPLPPEIPLKYHEAIAGSVHIPLVLFQLQPVLSGVIFEPETLARLLEIKNVIAIKEASFDAVVFVNTARIVRQASRKITLLTGNDNFILESFMLGAHGALIGFGTIAVAEQIEMIKLTRENDFSTTLRLYREKVRPLAESMFSPPVRNYRARLKEALRVLGILPNAAMRPPLLPLDEREQAMVHDALVAAGLMK